MKSVRVRIVAIAVVAIAAIWMLLSVWVEKPGASRVTEFNGLGANHRILVLYDPDPIYNLDQQVCEAIGRSLAMAQVDGVVATTKGAQDIPVNEFDGFVFCANTYNWSPDMAITDFIESHSEISEKPVAVVTLGSGSTSLAHAKLKDIVDKAGGVLVGEHEWWLMRPNDETRTDDDNVQVAVEQAGDFGRDLAELFKMTPVDSLP